jgi:hypothetical protein
MRNNFHGHAAVDLVGRVLCLSELIVSGTARARPSETLQTHIFNCEWWGGIQHPGGDVRGSYAKEWWMGAGIR